MQIQGIDSLQPGDILGKSLFNSRGDLLLASGYELDDDTIALMRSRGIMYVHVMNELTKDIQPQELISDTVRHMASKEVGDVFKAVAAVEPVKGDSVGDIKEEIEKGNKYKNMVKMPSMRRVVSTILEEVLSNASVMFSSMRMRAEDDGADYEHAVDTTVLCIMMGRSFHYSQSELRQLGVAAMLHDIGKVILGDLRNKKPYELNADERMLLREHPIYSSVILRENDDAAFVEQTVVMQHHEQLDGNGYPRELKASGLPPTKANQREGEIHRFAQVLAVANIYDNLVTGVIDERVYTPEEAVTAILTGRVGSWNSHVVKALVRSVQCYPVGIQVRIKNNRAKKFIGFRGVIAKENPDQQTNPAIILTHNGSDGELKPPKLIDFKDEEAMELEIVM